MDETKWVTWKKKAGQLGYDEIFVLVDKLGKPAPPLPSRPTEAQCCTTERIPFAMRRTQLLEKYEPQATA